MRALAVLLALACAGCSRPGGQCATDADCLGALHCSLGLCVVEGLSDIGERCEVPLDCPAWGACVDHLCALVAGNCTGSSGCGAWQQCQGHACVLRPDKCESAAGCPEWRDCTDHECKLMPGRCDTRADCSAWQVCDAHACRDIGAVCTGGADCQSWQTCAQGHCVGQGGRCSTDLECDPSWQLCNTADHACRPAAGKCGSDAECSGTATCGSGHVCKTAPVVIDGSGLCSGGAGFGNTFDFRRYQTFTARGATNLDSVEVVVSGAAWQHPGDVTVQLLSFDEGKPDLQLASAAIASSWFVTYGNVTVSADLHYRGLVPGRKYAVVLGQGASNLSVYSWCTTGSTAESFGKETDQGWFDESFTGNGWLKVYTSAD